jgi:hypothetical protein
VNKKIDFNTKGRAMAAERKEKPKQGKERKS